MFIDREDMQAVSSTTDPQLEIIKKHLVALQQFTDEEILAAQDSMEASSQRNNSSDTDENDQADESMDGDSDSSDDNLPLA